VSISPINAEFFTNIPLPASMAFTEPLASIQTCTRFLGHYMGAKSPRLPLGHRSTIRSPTSDQWLCMSQVTKEGS
jgi:hypothetical protein